MNNYPSGRVASFPVLFFILFTTVFTTVFFLFQHGFADTIIYSEGFESNNGGFTVSSEDTAEWEWGAPSGSVGPDGANSGTKCWGTDLDDTLDRNNTEGSILSPAITLPELGSDQQIRIRFHAFVAIDGMYDRAEFFVSDDGENWESVCEFFQSMDPSGESNPAWRKYEFSIDDDYAGDDVYLKFEAKVPYETETFFCGGDNDLSGFYIDDIAIILYDLGTSRKVFSMEAWEDPSAYASCPWVAPWNGKEFEVDNDIYSVARTKKNEYTDYYRLEIPLVARDGVYQIAVNERMKEDSFTDFVSLLQVDHAPDVSFAPDGRGGLVSYRPGSSASISEAVSNGGEDVLNYINRIDDFGWPAYSDDTVIVNFGTPDISEGARFVLRVAGFILGTGDPKPYVGPPAIVVETKDETGAWRERGRLKPRFDYSTQAFDLSGCLQPGSPVIVRLRSISHWTKYHQIDYAALYTGPPPPLSVRETVPAAASFKDGDILPLLAETDEEYVEMTSFEEFTLDFPVLPRGAGTVRDFVFVSRGYYIPKGHTFLIYTWDGSDWALRDGHSYPGSDFLRTFDLSLFLADPDGKYRVRVWQDYQWEPAGIDYVKMEIGDTELPLASAYDYREELDIKSKVEASDDDKTYWTNCPRDRICDFEFTPSGSLVNNPPSLTAAVYFPTIQWNYTDADGDAQTMYEVEVWTGPSATGENMWDPSPGSGTATSVLYDGETLTDGQTYYARVKVFDGSDWSAWAETNWVAGRSVLTFPAGSSNGITAGTSAGDTFTFQVVYWGTGLPTQSELWIDLNDDGSYAAVPPVPVPRGPFSRPGAVVLLVLGGACVFILLRLRRRPRRGFRPVFVSALAVLLVSAGLAGFMTGCSQKDENGDGDTTAVEKNTMTGSDASDTDPSDGKLYTVNVPVESAGTYSYKFVFIDNNSAACVGQPAEEQSFTAD